MCGGGGLGGWAGLGRAGWWCCFPNRHPARHPKFQLPREETCGGLVTMVAFTFSPFVGRLPFPKYDSASAILWPALVELGIGVGSELEGTEESP